MGWGMNRLRGARVFVALVLVTLLFRALVPTGYMVEASEAEGVRIAICTNQGFAEMIVDPSTGAMRLASDVSDDPEDDEPRPAAPCVFAGGLQVAPPDDGVHIEAVVYDGPTPRSAHARADLFDRGLFAPPPWSTGPPQAL